MHSLRNMHLHEQCKPYNLLGCKYNVAVARYFLMNYLSLREEGNFFTCFFNAVIVISMEIAENYFILN